MYVFLMDQGRLVSLDDNLLSQTVSSLRNVLAHDFDLPLNKQILLVSGGFQLEPGDKLSTYGAGLDKTNPIYVFTQTLPNDTSVQKPDVLQVNDGGYPRQLASLLELAPSEKVFEDRLRLIRALTPIGREAANAIEQLVSEQRQMIQGWCVALANLAEVATDTNKRLLFATSRLVQFEECISDWERKLYSFHELKKELSDLPLLPQLVVIGTSESTSEKESLNTTTNNNTSNIPKPKNLYEWVCLQSAISSIGTRYSLVSSSSSSSSTPSTIKSVGLQHLGVGGGGRVRTTSTGQLSSAVTTGVNQSSKVSFYTGGSQTSLNSLGMGCSNSSPPPLDNRLLIDQGSMNSVVNSNNLSTSIQQQQQQQQQHESSSTTTATTTGIDYYESAFLEIIKRAIDDIHSLRYGPDAQFQSTGNGKHQQGQTQSTDTTTTTTSSELTYVRAQTNRLSELITMVNTCSKSNYDEMTNSTVPHSSSSPSSSTSPASTEVNNTQLEGGISSSSSSSSRNTTTTTTTQGASSSGDSPPNTTAPPAAAVGLPDNRQQTFASASASSFSASSLHLTRDHDINYLMISVHDALDPGYFSQRLSQLDPLACEAIDLARKMIGIEQCTTKTFQQIVQQKINSLLQTKFTENTTNSQELIIAFNRLCEILGIVMQSKLLLANNLSDRQRWLQNFQSELNRLDAIIQHCLRRMCRVTTTGTLISQLGEAGSTYARCLAEIVRRTEFEDMLTQRSVYYLKEENHLRAEECRRRRIFSKHLKNNFLHTLFSPWTNPKTDCLGLINLPAPISMSQDVNDQQFCEMMSNLTVTSSTTATATANTAATTTPTTTTPTTSHKLESPTTPELSVNRRYALSSLSEPRLNELAKACALHRVSYRLRSSRLNSLSSPDPQLAKVKEDEMIESNQKKSTDSSLQPGIHQNQSINPSQNTATAASAAAAVPLRRQHIHTPTHRIDPSRRASMPSPEPERATSTSNWSIDSTSLALTHHFYASNTAVYNNSNNNNPHSSVKQPVKITRDDLDKLMQSMPASICNLLRTELNKSFSLFKSASFLANSSMSLVSGGPGGPLDQSTGLKLISTTTTTTTTTTTAMMVTTSTSTTAMGTTMGTTSITGTQINAPETKSTTTSPICSLIHLTPPQLVSVACQTEFNLIEPIINVGSGRSLNSSLGLSVDDSARRTANININNNTCWEELPGSLCSWELCRFPVIRSSRDRMSISLNTLPRFEHLFVTVGTQTDLPIDFVDDNSVYNSPVLSTTNSVDAAAAVLPSVDSELKGTVENDSECVSKTAPAPPHATSSCPNNTEDNEEMLDDNVVLSEIFTEAVDDDDDDADLFTDSALMMTSSFHSTRTTFSNNNNGSSNNHNDNQYDNDDDDNIDNLSHQHTPLMSITQSRCIDADAEDDTGCRSRSSRSSSGNLCYITDGVAAGDDGSTTTQYGSMMSDGVKTSPDDVLLLSSSSSPGGGSGVGGRKGVDGGRRHRHHHHHHQHAGEVLPPPESNDDQQNQTTPSLASSSAAILDNCCIKCQLRRKHHKEYFSLLQKCLQIINTKEENETNSLNPDVDADVTVNETTGGCGTSSQSTVVQEGTTPETTTTTTTAPLQSSDTIQTPLISLNRSQLKCLLSVLESCSLMFLKKSKHSLPCLSSHPPMEETSADDKVGTDHSDPDLLTTLKDNSEELINSTLNECTCSGVDENNEAASSSAAAAAADQFDFGKSLQYLLEALHLNNPVNTVSMATSTTPVHITNETTTSMITQTELIQGVDVATSITLLNQTIEDCNSEGGKTSTCISSSSSTTVPCVCDSAAASGKMKETTGNGGGVDIHTTDDSSSSNYLTVSSYNDNNNNSNNYNSSSSRNISSASTSAASRCTSPTSLSPVPLLQQQEQLANTSSSDNTNNIATSGNKHKSNNALETSTCNLSGISRKSAERYTSFVHSNFAPNDIVIFVPVQGSKPNTSGLNTTGATATTTTTTATDATSSGADSSMTTTTTATATMASNITPTTSCILSQQNTNNPNNNNNDLTNITKSDIWSVTSGKLSVNLLDVISPSSSLLSSMIVQSSLPLCSSIFGTSSGGGGNTSTTAAASTTTTATSTTTTTTKTMHKSAYPLNSNTALANEFYSSSALLGGEVFLPTVNATITTTTNTTAATTTLGTGELPLSAPSSPPMSSTTTATTTAGPHIQWRMLSSDGHVYFLHQDDFKALNIDENTDYCQPISSNLQDTSSTQNKNQSFKEAFPAQNHFIVARYQSKQRCLSKKASNRFNLPKNFIFYRVRASPLNLSSPPPSASVSSSESPSTMTSKQQNNNNNIKSNTTD